jgi:predicted permease
MDWFQNLTRDVRLSFRSLRASPGLTLVAVLSLGLGVGTATAVFSLANAILLRSLPVPRANDLRVLRWSAAEARGVRSFDGAAESRPDGTWTGADSVSPPALLSLRARTASQADIFGFYPLTNVAVAIGDRAFVADGLLVSDNFLSALQVRPFIGRVLQAGADYVGDQRSVVIGFDWWERHFGRDRAVLGRQVTLNGKVFTIVGVLAPGFTGVQPGLSCAFYVPMTAGSPFLYTALTNDWHWFVRLMARIQPGASDDRLAALAGASLASDSGAAMKGVRVKVEPGHAGLGFDRARYRRPLELMLAVVGLVIVSACANLAGLLLVRGTARRQEMALRAALGGSRGRLFQQALVESTTIAVLGGMLGVTIAVWGRDALAGLLAGSTDGLRYDFSLDGAVLAFSLALTLVSALLAGLLPSLRAGRAHPIDALRSRSALASPRLRAGRVLVTVQVALALLVLTSAGLFVRTVVNLTRLDAGFPLERLLLVSLNLRGGQSADADPARFYERAEAAAAAIPGVRSAAILEFPLLGPGGSTGGLTWSAGGPPTTTSMQVRRLRVSESFFATLGIPIVNGRAFDDADAPDAPKTVVVNESFVRLYLQGGDAIGLAFRMWEADWRIVGVCKDVKYGTVREAPEPTAYFPYKQMFYSRFRATHLRGASIAARTTVSPMALSEAIRNAVSGVDPGVAITGITTQEEVRDRGFAQERLLAALGLGLAALALFLSCVGLFGLMAYSVARRTGEIGLRLALGATRFGLTSGIVKDALLLTAAGVGVGLPLSFALTRLVKNQLFGVAPADPLSIGLAVATLFVTAGIAAWLPARRAQRVEPIDALRQDG